MGRGTPRKIAAAATLFGLLAVLVSECFGDDMVVPIGDSIGDDMGALHRRARPTPADIAGLRKLLAGSVVGPGDQGYANATHIQNARVLSRPAAVIFAASHQDVVHTIAGILRPLPRSPGLCPLCVSFDLVW